MKRADIYSSSLGSIISIKAGTKRGHRWLEKHVEVGVPYTIGAPVYCDHRYGIDILQAMIAAGLVLEDAGTGVRTTKE